jgi:hypothetical protein
MVRNQRLRHFDPWGKCTITATGRTLTLRVEAADEENLALIQDVLGRDIDRFGRRERLTAQWHRSEIPEPSSDPGQQP